VRVSWGFGLVILFVEDIKTLLCFHNLEEEVLAHLLSANSYKIMARLQTTFFHPLQS